MKIFEDWMTSTSASAFTFDRVEFQCHYCLIDYYVKQFSLIPTKWTVNFDRTTDEIKKVHVISLVTAEIVDSIEMNELNQNWRRQDWN